MIIGNEQAIESIAKIVEVAMKGAVAVEQQMDRAKARNRAEMVKAGMDADQIADAEECFEDRREDARATATRRIVAEALKFWAKQNNVDRIVFIAVTEESA